jgi:hypothetical protein
MTTGVALYSPDINLLTSHLQSIPAVGLYLRYKRVG